MSLFISFKVSQSLMNSQDDGFTTAAFGKESSSNKYQYFCFSIYLNEMCTKMCCLPMSTILNMSFQRLRSAFKSCERCQVNRLLGAKQTFSRQNKTSAKHFDTSCSFFTTCSISFVFITMYLYVLYCIFVVCIYFLFQIFSNFTFNL